MVQLLGFDNLPEDVAAQIGRVADVWKKRLQNRLVGVYLHGSVALKAFSPLSSDLDFLIVVEDSLDIPAKLAVARDIIGLDEKPCPLEMSAVTLRDLRPWKTPGNCVFHYSGLWKARYLERLSNPGAVCPVVDKEFPDPDVTSYIKLICRSGITLYGRDIPDVFSDVSDADFWEAITAGIDRYSFHDYGPRYLASNILILGRILSYKETRQILSKYEAGLWMARRVPEALGYLPELAVKMWYEGERHALPEEDLEKLSEYLIGEIKR